MTRRCKCEHWQDCPTCAPQRFDADGKRKPPEPTPLQACRAELETMREALALHEVGSAYAHRLAVMLECALLDPTGTWNEAHALLDEYRAACRAAAPMQEPPTFMGVTAPEETDVNRIAIAEAGVRRCFARRHEGRYAFMPYEDAVRHCRKWIAALRDMRMEK